MLKKIIFLLLLSVSLPSFANKIYYFEPTQVTLKGTIVTLTFPGRPNYEDIKKGDEAEK